MLAHKLRLVLTTRLDRARRGVPGRHPDPHRHDEAGLRPALRQGLLRHRRRRPPGVGVRRSRRASASAAHRSPASRPRRTSRAVDGVAAAEGAVSGYALLTDTDGKAVLTKGGAPTMGYSMPDDEALRGDVHLRSGHAPRGPHEVAIDASSAEEHDIALGSQHQGAVPRADPGVHRRRHRRLRRREGPRRHDVGVLRHRHRPAGARHARHVRRDRRPRGRRRQRRRTLAQRLDAVAARRASRRSPARRSRKEASDAINERVHVPQRPVRRLRRHRAVRRLVHHLEHLHDDRHPAVAGDRAAAGGRRDPPPGASAACCSRPACSASRRLGRRRGARRRRRQGAQRR